MVVTGAAGYIGSVVTELLCDAGHDVAAWDNLGNGHRAAVDPRARFAQLDLLDREAVRTAMRAERPGAVVHLAAEALVDVSLRDPGRFYRANLVGGINLLDAMVEAGSTRLVFSSTASTYGQPEGSPITEEMAGNPCNSYGESKWAFERALRWYETAHGLQHLSFRYFNACGATRAHGEDHRPETHIIPRLLATRPGPATTCSGCSERTARRPTARVSGTTSTSWTSPPPTCRRSGGRDVPSGAFNLGLGRGYSNREVIAAVEKVTGRRRPVEPAPRRPGDPDTLVADPARSRRVLGWVPRFPDLESMVASAWAWRQGAPGGLRVVIITRTPLRVSFAGGGTDLRAFYGRERGAVLSAAIDKYIYITVNRKFDDRVRASYSVTEMVDRASELRHELIREALGLVGIEGGVEITSISDVPSQGTGLGSSSSYTVGLLNALYAFTGRLVNAERLAAEACRIEIEICGKPIGKQDQYIAAYGGLQFMEFNPDESVFTEPIPCTREVRRELAGSLLMLYTGLTRSAADVLGAQRSNTEKNGETFAVLQRMRDYADALRERLCAGNLDGFGEVLHEGWMLKRTLADGITSAAIDDWYGRARRHGAVGGKLLGAGGGGFLLLYAHPERHAEICAALPELRPMPFSLEPQGSRIIFIE